MATQGMLSVVENGNTKIKIVAGSNGYNIEKIKAWLLANLNATPQAIYDKSLKLGFGSEHCLVVQFGANDFVFPDAEELGDLYATKFSDPKFNPRWERGDTEYFEIISI